MQTIFSQPDSSFYFRQLCVYGEQYMPKISQLNIYVHGLRGLGVEAAKCLILSGVQSITIQDDSILQINDLGSNAYCHEEDVGQKARAAASIDLLRAVNSRVKVNLIEKQQITESFLEQFDVVIFTDYYDKKKLLSYNQFCRSREKAIGFIYGGVLGLYGFVFVDFGKSFIVSEVNSEEPAKGWIEDIRKKDSDFLEVKLTYRHKQINEGDYVRFDEIKGFSQLNGQVYKVHSVKFTGTGFYFLIHCDSTSFEEYICFGYVIPVKMPAEIQFIDLETSLTNLETISMDGDFSKFGQSEKLHKALGGILNFYEINQRLPDYHIDKEVQQLGEIQEEVDNLCLNLIKYSQVQISSQCSFFGGVIAQEALKYIGKFMPLKQWLHYDTFDMIPQGINDRFPLGSRYDDQITLFGKGFQENLMNQKVLIIGAGTLGCELLKQFALIGFGCGENGKITCVDSGTVKHSNLSRQSLYKEKDIGRAKCQVACEAVLKINPQMNIEAKKTHIANSEETWKSDEFWEEYDLIVCAVNSTQARLDIDKMCILHQKPMLDCGMKGAQASTQVIIPFKSQTYGESTDPYDDCIPLDRAYTFPSILEDCITWAEDQIKNEFFNPTEHFLEYSQNPQKFIHKIKEASANQNIDHFPYQLRDMKKLIQTPSSITPELCLQYAIQIFKERFSTQIIKLVTAFPPDKIQDGKPFWGGWRKCPQVITFDPEDPIHASFIFSAANLYAKMFDLPLFTDKFAVAQQAKNIEFPQNLHELTAKEMIQILETQEVSSFPKVIEMEYSRENQIQLEFIYATSILRARNYFIDEAPFYKVNMIAGKFSPALITTATTITGALSLEIFKLTLVFNYDIQRMRNMFINLEVPMYVCSEPAEPTKTVDKEYHPIFMGPVKAFPSPFMAWDMIDIKGPMTTLEILEYFKKIYGIKLSILSSSSTILYSNFMPQGGNYLSLPLDEAVVLKCVPKIALNSKYIILEASAEGPNDEYDILLPSIRYIR